MSTVGTFAVFCDHGYPAHPCPQWVGREPSPAEARKVARASGWYVAPRGGRTGPRYDGPDYCPAHREAQ